MCCATWWAVVTTRRPSTCLVNIRLPRLLLGGGWRGPGAGGGTDAGPVRNLLADPGLIGVSSGAALAAASFIVMGNLWLDLPCALGSWTLVSMAFMGGLVVTFRSMRWHRARAAPAWG